MSKSKQSLPTTHRASGISPSRLMSITGFLVVLALLVAGCGSTPPPAGQVAPNNTPAAAVAATATATTAPTATPLPAPVGTAAPAATPLPAPTEAPEQGPPTIPVPATAIPAAGSTAGPAVVVADQPLADGGVTITEVVSDGPGWLVVHAQADGKPGPILGYTPVSDGVNRGVVVQIDLTAATATLYAMLHTDGGTVGTWEFPGGPDTPVTVDGQVVSPAFQVQALSGEAEVEIEDFAFHPKVLVIRAGTTVKWANKDNVQHTATADDNLWDSGYLNKGDTFSYTFAEPGVYPYYCMPHGGPGGQGMSGTVVVLK